MKARPTNNRAARNWDNRYGETHNPDGTPKFESTAVKDAKKNVEAVKVATTETITADSEEAKAAITSATTAYGNKIAEYQPGSSITKIREMESIIRQFEKENGSGRTTTDITKDLKDQFKGIFGDTFKELLGEDLRRALAKGLVLYLGGRLTGMNGQQALGLAAKTVIGDAETARENKRANEEARQKFELDNYGKFTPESIKKYWETKNTEDLVKLKGYGDIDFGKHTQTVFVGGGVGSIEVYSDTKGKGAYVSWQGTPVPLEEFRRLMQGQGFTVEKFKDSVHDEQSITDHFAGVAGNEATKLSTQNKNQFGDKSNELAINNQIVGQEAQTLYFDWMGRRQWKDVGELKHNVGLAVQDYIDAKNKHLNNPDEYNDPGSLEAFANRRLFKIETGLPFNNVANTTAENYAEVRTLVMNDVRDTNDNPVSQESKNYANELKTDWTDMNKLWNMIDKTDDAKLWKKKAGVDPKTGKREDETGWDPKMLFFRALLDPSHPNHQEALRTQRLAVGDK